VQAEVSTDLSARNGAPPIQEKPIMDLTIEFDDEDAMTFLMAKRCMEDELDDTMDFDDEFVARLCERYLDQRKGEEDIYDSDPELE
jgi:hypothetical protein